MWSQLRPVLGSARVYLWPAIVGNTLVMALGGGAGTREAFLLGSSLSCLASFGFLINDIWDRPVDKINKSKRLEDAGRSVVWRAGMAAVLLFAIGIVLSLLVSVAAFKIALLISLGLILYSVIVRRILLAATILSAFLGTSPLWYPLMLSDQHSVSFASSLVFGVYLMFVAREVLLDIKDMNGDRLAGRHTFASIYGKRIAGLLSFSASLSSAVVLLSILATSSDGISDLGHVVMWGIVMLLLILGVIPGLHASVQFAAAGQMTSYIRKSRLVMLLLPLALGLFLLVV